MSICGEEGITSQAEKIRESIQDIKLDYVSSAKNILLSNLL
jgi:hypothetical protein